MSNTSPQSQPLKQKQTRTRITPSGWVMILLLLALGAINYADKAVLGLAAVPIIKELHLSPTQYGLVSGSLFWLYALSSLLVTAWSDRIGTKKVLTLLATSWAIVQLAAVFVFTFPGLLLTRIVLGAGEGPTYGTSVAAATPWLPSDRRAFGLSLVTSGGLIGPALFAPLLTLLIVMIGWRLAFAFLGGIGLLWVILWLLAVREPPERATMPLQATQVKPSRTDWSQIRPVLFSRTFLVTTLALVCAYWMLALYLSWNPVYLVTVRHLRLSDPLYLAGITLPYIVGGIGQIAFGALADGLFRRTGSHRRSYVYPGTAALLLGALCVYLAVSVPSAVGCVLLFTLAPIAVANPTLVTITSTLAPAAHRGAILGILVAVVTLPGLIAPWMTGLIIQATGKNVGVGFHNAYLLASLFLMIVGVVFLACVRPGDELLEEKRSIADQYS